MKWSWIRLNSIVVSWSYFKNEVIETVYIVLMTNDTQTSLIIFTFHMKMTKKSLWKFQIFRRSFHAYSNEYVRRFFCCCCFFYVIQKYIYIQDHKNCFQFQIQNKIEIFATLFQRASFFKLKKIEREVFCYGLNTSIWNWFITAENSCCFFSRYYCWPFASYFTDL